MTGLNFNPTNFEQAISDADFYDDAVGYKTLAGKSCESLIQAADLFRPAHDAAVGGFTRNPNSGVRDTARGTFAGLVEKIPYLMGLGITVVELMPVLQCDPDDGNYWGYVPLNFFSLHPGKISISPANCHKEEKA